MKMNQRKIRRVEARVFIWFCEDGRIGSKRAMVLGQEG
jgi:hypothetical protein